MVVRLPFGELLTAQTFDHRANGERVQVALDSKGKYHVVEHAGSAVATTQKPITVSELQPTYNSHNGRSAEIADYVERLGKLFRHCYNSVEGIGEKSDQRAIATTLFIQTVKHFEL